MEKTLEERIKDCRESRAKWLLITLFGMIPVLITGIYLCINSLNFQLLESQSTIIFGILGGGGITSMIGMFASLYYSNKESELRFEETSELLDSIETKLERKKNENKY
jgi:membrane-bound ClpP family serine protease